MIIEKVSPFIEAMPENKSPSPDLRMSSSGKCPRLLDYELQRGCKPVLFADFMRMEMGHSQHYMVQDIFARALGDDLFDSEKEISITTPDGHVIPGHSDGRIKSLHATLELKSVSENTFRMINGENKPLDQHIDQGNLYAHTVHDQYIIILYVNRNTGEFLEFMFETSKELADRVLHKFDRAKRNQAAKVMTERPYFDKTESPCFYCPYRDECYEGFKEEVSEYAKIEMDSTGLAKIARDALVHRTQRLVSEKAEDKAKEEVSKRMYACKVREAKLRDETGLMLVTVSVGKNNNLLPSVKEIKE